MTPPAVDGTSIVAFSVSRVTSGASVSMLSPGLTRTSMTATSLKLPMSGTRTSTSRTAAFIAIGPSDFPGYGLGGIDAERFHRAGERRLVDLAFIREGLQSGHRDVVTIDFEVLTQGGTRIGAAVAVGAESDITAADPFPDLVGYDTHVVGRGDDRTRVVFQQRLHVRDARRLTRMHEVPTLGLERLTSQLAEARDREHIGRNAVLALENLRSRKTLAQDRARAEQRGTHLPTPTGLQRVAALENALLHALRQRGLLVILVHDREVIENVFLIDIHAAHAVMNDDSELV